ncbi:hypothetical protein G4B88_026412 [Cannabis sativa]|uniref:Transposase MuDR plant domain-containing protein n=1 Tax=Cannabis sativa TaxID=3483 RepID=A0A7J6FYI8_CANSA|nr:hypothetical protein G4B88_026412 [Cannabis sativa]
MGKKRVSSSRKKRGYPRPAPERSNIKCFHPKVSSQRKLVDIARDVGHKNWMALKVFFKWVDSDVVECVTSNGELWEKIGASIKKSHMLECYAVEEVVSPTNETENLTQDGVDLGNGVITQGPVLDGQIDNGWPDLAEKWAASGEPVRPTIEDIGSALGVEKGVVSGEPVGPTTDEIGSALEAEKGAVSGEPVGPTTEEIGSALEAEKGVVSGEPVGPTAEEIGTGLEAEMGVVGGELVGPTTEEIGTGLEEFLPCFEAEIWDVTTEAVRLGNKEIYGEHEAEKITRDDDFVAAAMKGFDTFGMGNGEESDYDEELNENNDVAVENAGTFEANNGPANEDSEDDGDPDYIMDEEEEEETNADNRQREGKRHVDFDVDEVVVESDGEKIVFESSSSDIESEIEETNEFHTRKRKSKRARMPHLLEFRPDVDMVKVKFEKGLAFQSGSQFKDAMREYAIQNGKDIFFKKNEPTKVRAKCGGVNCPWELYASKIDDTPTFVVKTFNETHQCPRINTNRFATGKWLGKKYLDEFKMHDKWGISSFHLKVGKDHTLKISRDKAYRARTFAKEWPRSGKLVMVKHEGKIQPGRPKKNRRLELDGIAPPGAKRLRRRFHRMRCSGCGLQGHNFRTCSKNNKNKANEAPADPGEYSRNVNREINQFVSSAIRDSSLQPATTQAELSRVVMCLEVIASGVFK